MRISVLAFSFVVVACGGTAITRESLRPIPEHPASPSASPLVRGTEQAAARAPGDQQVAIIREVVRRFYRPLMSHARWIDPKPLAHQRTRAADSLAAVDESWALAIVQAVGLSRVCPLTEANAQCRGRQGGVLRFSKPYVVGAGGTDSALVYARYTPVSFGVQSEIEFFVVRRDGAWQVVSRRGMPEMPTVAAVSSDVADPQRTVDELLAADRAFSQEASKTDLVTGLSNMFVGNVIMQAPLGHVRGRDAVIAALNVNPDNSRSRVEWTPVRGGVSSDGQQGFTFGYMTITRPDGTTQPAKYVAYWLLQPRGWRVVAYKRVPRAEGAVSLALLPPSLPIRALPRGDSATVRRYADELSAAEHAFSRDAQPMSLGPAFFKWGAPDAVNTGGGNTAEFVRGPDAIARSVEAGYTSGMTVTWAPTDVIVASTGDLGVSIGTIRITDVSANVSKTRDVPFFTIWKRAYPSDPWRYVAE
jgi:hypothetical protein